MYGSHQLTTWARQSRYRRQSKPPPAELVRRHYPAPGVADSRFCGLYSRLYWFLRTLQYRLSYSQRDNDLDEFEAAVVRYKPDSVESIQSMTKFSKREIQLMYRGFKQGCPSGIVSMAQFKEIYAQFFPHSGSSRYAELVFTTFDRDGNGSISFEEFVMGLSVLTRGSLDEKLNWVFDLYDINRRGRIGQEEMACVIKSMYDLLGKNASPPVAEKTIIEHVQYVFQKMDYGLDGTISRRDFIDACKQL